MGNSRTKDDALIGVSLAINELIVNDELDDAIGNSLRYIGEAFDEDCFVLEIRNLDEGTPVTIVRNYWMKRFDQKRIDLNNNLSLIDFPDVLQCLADKKPYVFSVNDASPVLLEHIKKTGGKAGILFPIYINNQLWGIFSIATTEEEQKWTILSRSIFTSYSFALAATINKIQYSQTLEEEVEKKSKEIFRRNEQLASLIANTPGIVFQCLLNEYWTMSYISPYVEEVSGYSANRFINSDDPLTFESLIHENDRNFVRDEINEQLSKSPIYKVNYRIVDAQDNIKWMWEQGVKTKRDEQEDVLEGCIIDISDSVLAQEKIMSATLETEDRERSRIASEIHDNLQQVLTTAHLNLEFGKKKVRQGINDFSSLDTASEYLTKAIDVSRNLSHRLMPKAIEDYGYSAAVESLLENLNETINTELSYYDNLKTEMLPTHIALSLYRITQEAITNVIKYANASKATIQLMYHNSSLILSIDDNGQGFDTKSILNEKGAFGLNNMKNRAESIGGRFDVDSSVGRGTQILIELPYQTKTT